MIKIVIGKVKFWIRRSKRNIRNQKRNLKQCGKKIFIEQFFFPQE